MILTWFHASSPALKPPVHQAPEPKSVQGEGSDNARILRPLNPEAASFVPVMARGELGVGKRTQIAAVKLGTGGSTERRGHCMWRDSWKPRTSMRQ